MQKGNVHFKPLDPGSIVEIRTMPLGRSEHRLISASRRRSKPAAGFIVELTNSYPVGVLLELDLAFPGQPHKYRARGMVSWVSKSENPKRPHKIWIHILGMNKLDPNAVQQEVYKPAATVVQAPMGAPVEMAGDYPQTPDLEGSSAATVAQPIGDPALAPAVQQVAEPAAVDPDPVAASPAEPVAQAEPAAPDVDKGADHKLKPPTSKAVSELLTNLVGEEVVVKQLESGDFELEDIAAVGEFVGDDGTLLTVCTLDLAAGSWLGAALAMIPKAAVEKDLKAKRFSDEVQENIQEVFNISSSVFHKSGLPHFRFSQLHLIKDNPPPDTVQALLDDPASKIDLEMEVPGYGSGRISYYMAHWKPSEPAEPAVEDAPESAPVPAQPEPGGAEESPDSAVESDSGRKALDPPGPKQVSELLASLVGEDVPVERIDSGQFETADFAVAGDFVSNSDEILSIAVLDIAAANWLGAALPMIPKATVAEDVKNKKMSEEVQENVQEIFNISASAFNTPEGPHHRFRKLYLPLSEDLPDDVQELIDQPASRADFEVDVPGYGSGRICFIAGWA